MKVLAVIDMQNDFISGSLGTPEAQAIVPKVREKILSAYENGDYILYTRDTHREDYLNTPEGKKLPVEHCIKNTWGWNIPEELMIHDASMLNAQVWNKKTFGVPGFSKFLMNDLELLDEPVEIEEIELIGLCTDICVISNAIILKNECPDIPIIVDASCCAGVTPETHEAALKTMKMCQIDVINE